MFQEATFDCFQFLAYLWIIIRQAGGVCFPRVRHHPFVALQFDRLFDDLHLFSLLCWQFRRFASTWRYWPTHRLGPPKSGTSTGEVEQDWLGNLLDLWRYIFGFKSKDNLTVRASASDYTGVYFSFAYMERRITMPIRRSIRPAFLRTSLAPRPNMRAQFCQLLNFVRYLENTNGFNWVHQFTIDCTDGDFVDFPSYFFSYAANFSDENLHRFASQTQRFCKLLFIIDTCAPLS